MLALATACAPTAPPAEQEVTSAMQAVADWLAVDDDQGVTTEDAADRAGRLVRATAPLVEARPPIEGLDDPQTRAFHDALAALQASVAEQRAVLDDCQQPDPVTCIERSDLDPTELQEAVERFQDAIAPLGPSTPDT